MLLSLGPGGGLCRDSGSQGRERPAGWQSIYASLQLAKPMRSSNGAASHIHPHRLRQPGAQCGEYDQNRPSSSGSAARTARGRHRPQARSNPHRVAPPKAPRAGCPNRDQPGSDSRWIRPSGPSVVTEGPLRYSLLHCHEITRQTPGSRPPASLPLPHFRPRLARILRVRWRRCRGQP